MLLLLFFGAGTQAPDGVRAYAAISFGLVNAGAISLSLVSGAEGSVS